MVQTHNNAPTTATQAPNSTAKIDQALTATHLIKTLKPAVDAAPF
jgi:hypothetical protein